MKKTSNFHNCLLLSYGILAILPIILVTSLILNLLIPNQIQSALQLAAVNCEYLSSTVNANILEMQTLLRALYIRRNDGVYVSHYLVSPPPEDEYTKLQIDRIFNDIFVELSVFRTDLSGISLTGKNGEFFSYFQNTPVSTSNSPKIELFTKSSSKPYVSGTHEPVNHPGGEPVFSVVFPLWTYNLEEIAGLLQVDYKVDSFEAICSGGTLKLDEQIYIYTQNGDIIYSNQNPSLNQQMPSDLVSLVNNATSKVSEIHWNNQAFYLVRPSISNSLGIQTIYLLPKKTLFTDTYAIIYSVLGAVLILTLCIFLTSRHLSARLSRPVKVILEQTRKIGDGYFDTRFPTFPYQEFNDLASVFNQQLEMIQHSIQQKYILTLSKKEAQIKALLAQINPHFINNTLEIISGIAFENNEPQIYHTVNALGSMLHYTIKTDSDMVPLRAELNYIDKLLAIYNLRFEPSIHLETSIEKTWLLDIPIPKLILQPIIENSVKYKRKKVSLT